VAWVVGRDEHGQEAAPQSVVDISFAPEFRVCLRPDLCPYRKARMIAADPELCWRALTAVLPGDPALARELATAVAGLVC
jgi:hypothetical protein